MANPSKLSGELRGRDLEKNFRIRECLKQCHCLGFGYHGLLQLRIPFLKLAILPFLFKNSDCSVPYLPLPMHAMH